MKLFLLVINLALISPFLHSQTTIYGKITDEETGEELIAANIVLSANGVFASGTATDFSGNYSISVDPGTYDISVTYTGYPERKITGVIANAGQRTKLDVQMASGVNLDMVTVVGYKVPLIEQDNTSCGAVITSEEIRNLPTKNIRGLASSTAGLTVVENGNAVGIKGSRSDATDYYVDGLRVRGSSSLIGQKEFNSNQQKSILGGTPAVFENKTTHVLQNTEKGIISIVDGQVITDPIVPAFTNESYEKISENNFLNPTTNKFSTFSIDVDYASYSNIRRYINYGQTPPQEAVRIEEMINYFNYEYEIPDPDRPFSINTELGECPWNERHKLLHIGLQGEQLKFEKAVANNLVFLIDVSGSMNAQNKLPLLKKSFSQLIEQLRDEDKIAIVVYAGAAGLVLPSTPISDKATILKALDNLRAGGSTAGGAGIKRAYDVAIDNFIEEGNNRVILATDGDFNIGESNKDELHKLIEQKRQSGVYLTVLGFGMGNLKDNNLETLADKGNGHYAYIDDLKESEKVFVHELTSTLYTIAKDVKIQLVFNPKHVKSYRLIGYENRMLAKEDFEDDKKDAGELGAGHTVTAIYELELNSDRPTEELMDVKLRYKLPKENQSRFINQIVYNQSETLENTSDNFRFSAAVAAFGMILKGSKYMGDADCQMVIELAEDASRMDNYGYRKEFLELVERYETMTLTSGN